MTDEKSESRGGVLILFDTNRTRRLAGFGRGVLRYGLVALLLLWGGFKFFDFEAEGIRPLVEHSPLLSWLYPLLGVRGAADLIGVVEVSAAILIALRRWRPDLSAVGSLLAAGTFLVTLGNVLLWAARSSYLPWPWSALDWYVWLPAEAAFALAPLYQLQAVYAARSSRRTP